MSSFEQYLSYGSTDQQTARLLSGQYDGLLVPGTVAAFQAAGTKGFVLTLSASRSVPYVLDSRFPLFQNRLSRAKVSHQALAGLLNAPELVRADRDPEPEDFNEDLLKRVAIGWMDFNSGFTTLEKKHFDKYAAKLHEQILPDTSRAPDRIFAPYLMSHEPQDDWQLRSEQLWSITQDVASSAGMDEKLWKVIASDSPEAFAARLASETFPRVAIWLSPLDELDPSSEPRLRDYGQAIKRSSDRQELFALYGGFLSVLLSGLGLKGSSHGIGFGESRDWIELPQSGPPPARYYLPSLHRYVAADFATVLQEERPDLVACACAECNGISPSELDYQSLMRHSVLVRTQEIEEWGDLSTNEAVVKLTGEVRVIAAAVRAEPLLGRLNQRFASYAAHLPMWVRLLQSWL